MGRFLHELKRRNIVRVAILYVSVCWAILDPLHVLLILSGAAEGKEGYAKALGQPVLILMAAGLPVVLFFTWAFELTPTGLKPTMAVDPSVSIRPRTGRRLDRAIIVVLAIALAYLVADRYGLVPGKSPAQREPPAALPGTPRVEPLPAVARAPLAAAPAEAARAPAAVPAPVPAPAPAAVPASVAPAPAAEPMPRPGAAPIAVNSSGGGAQARAVVTILDGQALFVRGLSRFAAGEGVRLTGGDIVATGPDAFLQLEYEGGTRVEVGPQTQLMLPESEAGPASRQPGYLLSGWIKVTASQQSPDELGIVRSAWFELKAIDNVAVARVAGDGADVFAEAGGLVLIERTRGKSSAELTLKPGQFYTRRLQRPGAVLARPSSAFLGQMPVGYRDTLPPRLSLFQARAAAPQPAPEFTYADVEPWLKSEPAIRAHLVQQWRDRAREPAFRSALQAHLAELPEWYPILYPPPPKDVPEERPPAPVGHPVPASPAS